ncbi:MAG TPA: PilZ domain-containing protein [Sphingomicrobium sp.]|nr:PilZ domain-containing protein [Sphingomicrobium sp.]
MDNSYFTRRLFDTLTLAEQAPDAAERSVYLRACHYYTDLLCQPEARAAERLTVDLPARLLFDDGEDDASVALDLSCYGFRLQDRPGLRPGKHFGVALQGLAPVTALVIWRDHDWAGCKFTTPLHPALLEAAAALSRSPKSPLSWPPRFEDGRA